MNQDTVWLDTRPHTDRETEGQVATDLVVLTIEHSVVPGQCFNLMWGESGVSAGPWLSYEEASTELKKAGFELLGPL